MDKLRRPSRWTFRTGRGLAALVVVGSFLVGVAASGMTVVAAAAAAPASWTIASSPDPVYSTGLNSVSCVGPSDCTAVGSVNSTLRIEHWNGTAWSTVPSVTPSPFGGDLNGVSCASVTFCMAVGDYWSDMYTDRPFVEVWNGIDWTMIPSPDPGYTYSYLQGVSCVSATDCVAVGSGINMGGPAVPAWAEEWNGSTWTIQTTPSIGIPTDLNGVSCTGPSACTAVGSLSNGNVTTSSLVEVWNGSAWSTVPTLRPVGAIDSSLNGVSCTTPTDCVAVGSWSNGTGSDSLVEIWNGLAWWPVESPSPSEATSTVLEGVSCAGPICSAFGHSYNSSGAQILVETGPNPATVLKAPTKVQATAGDQQASVSFDRPRLTAERQSSSTRSPAPISPTPPTSSGPPRDSPVRSS